MSYLSNREQHYRRNRPDTIKENHWNSRSPKDAYRRAYSTVRYIALTRSYTHATRDLYPHTSYEAQWGAVVSFKSRDMPDCHSLAISVGEAFPENITSFIDTFSGEHYRRYWLSDKGQEFFRRQNQIGQE